MHVRKVFGGEHVVHSTFVHSVRGTAFGTFSVEMDTTVLKDKTYEKPLRAIGISPRRWDVKRLEQAILGTFATVVPAEVATPPLPVTELAPLDDLRRRLRDSGAGHAGRVAQCLRAAHQPGDRVGRPGVPPVGSARVRAAVPVAEDAHRGGLRPAGQPVHQPVPAGLRAADPLAGLPRDARQPDQRLPRPQPDPQSPARHDAGAGVPRARAASRTASRSAHLVKPRPAFHYRLPNCMVDEPHWTVAREWNTWVAVERLAARRGAARGVVAGVPAGGRGGRCGRCSTPGRGSSGTYMSGWTPLNRRRCQHERPIVGVTGPDAGGAAAWWFTRLAVWLAGGHAVRITPITPPPHRRARRPGRRRRRGRRPDALRPRPDADRPQAPRARRARAALLAGVGHLPADVAARRTLRACC